MSTSVASVTSHFPDAENGFTTTTSGSVASGATTVGLNSTAGYTNGEPVVFVIDPSDSSKKQTFTGIIDTSGNQVTGVVWTAGTNVAHSAGATVVDYATATHIAMISKGIKVAHNQDGTHKSGATYTLPVVTDFTNATHTHANAAGGGQLTGSAIVAGSQLADRLLNPYKFSVYLAANQTGIVDATITKVAWDTKRFDTGSNFDVTTNRRFVAPIAGFYQINANIDIQSAGNTMVASICYLYKNGSNFKVFHNTYPNVGVGNQVEASGTLSELVQLAANDYLEIFVYGDVTSSTVTVIGASTGSTFSGFLVSAT